MARMYSTAGMKRELRKIPFVGFACQKAHHIFVDKRGPSKVKETYDTARATLGWAS